MEYFFIGDAELLTAFRLVGIDGEAARRPQQVQELFRRVTSDKSCRVLILSEEAADWLGEELSAWQLAGNYPLVVEVPGLMGRLEGRKTLTDSIREAIGIQV